MATFKQNENGEYIDEKGNYLKRKNNGSNLVQQNETSKEENYEIEEDEHTEELYKKEEMDNAMTLFKDNKNFNPLNFLGDLSKNSEMILKQLLSIQTNKNPLKKGGTSIGFQCDALIIATRNYFTNDENIVFDYITALISSQPEDQSYIITTRDLNEIYHFKDRTAANKILNKAAESLKSKNIEFPVNIGGKEKIIAMPFHYAIIYTEARNITNHIGCSFIEFVPSPIFKAMCISSKVLNGAHYSISISNQFTGHTRTLFYFLQSRKGYKEYPNATPGRFKVTADELKFLFRLSPSYLNKDINNKILKVAKKKFDETEGMDFSFEFEQIKGYGKTIIGFEIFINSEITEKEKKNAEIQSDPETSFLFMILKDLDLTEDDKFKIINKYKENERDPVFLTKAVAMLDKINNIKSVCGVLCDMMDNGLYKEQPVYKTKTEQYQSFKQNTYDYDELERELLGE